MGGSALAVAGSLLTTTPAQATSAAAAAPAAHAPEDQAPVHLIIDTDIFSDVDDTGALAIANAAQDGGKVDLLGVMVDTPSKWGAPASRCHRHLLRPRQHPHRHPQAQR